MAKHLCILPVLVNQRLLESTYGFFLLETVAKKLLRYYACRFPSASLVRMLLRVGAEVNVRDPEGNTALHLAAKEKPVDARLITDLLNAGAYIDAINNQGETMEDLMAPLPIHNVVNPLKYRTLATLAARTLARRTCPQYYVPQLPRTLIPLVLEH